MTKIGGIPHRDEITQLIRKNQELEKALQAVLNKIPDPQSFLGNWVWMQVQKALSREYDNGQESHYRD